jgi:hypothetical protein
MEKLVIIGIVSLILTSCKLGDVEYTYPQAPDEVQMKKIGSFANQTEEGVTLFSFDKSAKNDSPKIGKNTAWKAALETVKFMPLLSVDAANGIIITDWYQDIKTPSERYKLTVIVSEGNLSASSFKINVHRQIKKGGDWINVEANPQVAKEIEDKMFINAKNINTANYKLIK